MATPTGHACVEIQRPVSGFWFVQLGSGLWFPKMEKASSAVDLIGGGGCMPLLCQVMWETSWAFTEKCWVVRWWVQGLEPEASQREARVVSTERLATEDT